MKRTVDHDGDHGSRDSEDGQEVEESSDILRIRDGHKVGDSVVVKVDRDGKTKELDLVITDHITIKYNGNDKIDNMINMYKDYIMGETLANKIEKESNLGEKTLLNDKEVEIKIKKD